MDITQILNEIDRLESEEDLKKVFEAYRDRAKELRTEKDFMARSKFKAGDKVFFDSRKKGRRIVGTIKKVNYSRAEIVEDRSITGPYIKPVVWTLPLSMLNPVV